MKRALSISIDYRRHWDAAENDGPWWPMLREYAQGAIDEETVNPAHKASITYDPRNLTVKISTADVKLPFSIWLLGESTKMDDDRTIGGYGEGFKIATLVAVRNNIPVTIRNGADEVWVPTLEADDAFPDKQVLKVEKLRRVRLKRSFDIEVVGVTADIWKMFSDRLLMLKNPAFLSAQRGDILVGEEEAGRIYIKGVYVHSNAELAYGYNLKDVKPDVDRRMTDSYDLKSATLDIWQSLATDDEKFSKFYELLNMGKHDVDHSLYLYEDTVIDKLVQKFQTEFGKDAIPTWSYDTYQEGGRLGLKMVQVGPTLGKLLVKKIKSLEVMKQEQSRTITTKLSLQSLSPEQRSNYDLAIHVIVKAIPTFPLNFTLVQFVDSIREFDVTNGYISVNVLAKVEKAINALLMVNLPNWVLTPEGVGHDRATVLLTIIGVLLNEYRTRLNPI